MPSSSHGLPKESVSQEVHRVRLHPLLPSLFALSLTACSTMNNARPSAPGEHAVGLTLGGPIVEFGAPIPLPNAIAEGKHGVTTLLERNLEINYGLNLTGLAFGILQGHVGAAWELMTQEGWRPALAISNRIFLATNPLWLGEERSEFAFGFWGANQTELLASWKPGGQLLYAGIAQYLDFGAPSLLLTPILGTELDVGLGGFRVQLEARYFAVGRQAPTTNISWFPGGAGALGFSLGFGYHF